MIEPHAKVVNSHVCFVTGSERRVVQATDSRHVKIVQQDRVGDLLNGDVPNIFGGEEGEGERGRTGGEGASYIHVGQ